ncbi:MAG TPA: hypothetical protein VFD64_08045, partial [Gemmatimonadaceae bacterium]|nr:hypothetical protein [Gemmatimonadaceae bacterium]
MNQSRLLVLGATSVALWTVPVMNAAGQRTTPAPTVPVSAPISNVRYSVTFNRTTAPQRSLRVSMTFSVASNEA